MARSEKPHSRFWLWLPSSCVMFYLEIFNLVYLSFLYKVLRDLQETLEIEIYSQSKNELKVENLDEKGKRNIYRIEQLLNILNK